MRILFLELLVYGILIVTPEYLQVGCLPLPLEKTCVYAVSELFLRRNVNIHEMDKEIIFCKDDTDIAVCLKTDLL